MTTTTTTVTNISIDGKTIAKKAVEKKEVDYKKVNKTRRSRGYNFEYNIVNAFNDHHSKDWTARRLGGSSTGLPDVVATNKSKSILYAIEAKSAQSDIIYIPRDQIERCLDITEKFLTAYKTRLVVFGFKFKANKKKGRKLQYRFNLMSNGYGLPDHLKGISYNIKTGTLNTHEYYEDYPICLPVFGKTQSITEFVNQI